MTHVLSIQPRDPIVARDGRPFGSVGSNRMRSLDWPLPMTTAGAIRTLLGQAQGGDFRAALIDRLKQVSCHGPLPVSEGQLFLPAAQDALRTRDNRCLTLRPEHLAGGGVDLPTGLCPATPTELPEAKLDSLPAWWSKAKMTEWLLTSQDAPSDFFTAHDQFRQSPRIEERTHVQIDPDTFAAKEQQLFTTAGLALDRLLQAGDDSVSYAAELAMRIDVGSDEPFDASLQGLSTFQPLGGERRVVHIRTADSAAQDLFDCPKDVRQRLADVKQGHGLRMVLATPAIFEPGWRPGWLNEEGGRVGTPPGVAGHLKLQLVAVSNQRWDAVSGWSYETRSEKPIKRMVPAGGAYFFRIQAGDGNSLCPLWLQPVSDDAQDRRDGFGLAMWGVWEER
jgi:CRISPR-associated protein Cmr3